MWNLIQIPLVAGVGNANLFLPSTEAVGRIAIPAQAAINSGVTKVVISHILPNAGNAAFPLITLTTVTTPYSEVPSAVPVNAANAAQSNNVFHLGASFNVSVTGGVGANTAEVWILTT